MAAKSKTTTEQTADEKKVLVDGEQKKASDAAHVVDTGSTLVGGPTQDDLNPAFAPPKDENNPKTDNNRAGNSQTS